VQVDRCICADISFADLVRLARDEGLSLDGLAARTGCTKGCRLCEPYVRLALATGSMAFPVLHPLTIERMIAEAEEGA
jgi:bacterioferritin-associated ferredoxin